MPVILATVIQDQLGQIVLVTLFQPIKAGCSGMYLSSQLHGKSNRSAGQPGYKMSPYLKNNQNTGLEVWLK
jgi:hypothetical protein